jgi:hypothetical protein
VSHVATLAGAGEQLAVIHSVEQADVVNLGFARQEELHRARGNVCGVVGQNAGEGCVDLVRQGEPLRHDACDCRVSAGVDLGLRKDVGHVLLTDQAGLAVDWAPVDHTVAVVCVEHV